MELKRHFEAKHRTQSYATLAADNSPSPAVPVVHATSSHDHLYERFEIVTATDQRLSLISLPDCLRECFKTNDA